MRPPSSGEIGARLKRLRKKPVKASAIEQLRVEVLAETPDGGGAEPAEDRPGDRHLRLRPGVVGQLLQRDQRAEEGDEHRRRDGEALAPRLEHVAELVHEQQQDEADRELPAPEERVGADRDQHRAGDGQELELEDRGEDELELPEQEPERGDRRPEPAQDVARGLRPLDRRVVVRRLLGLARRVRVVTHRLRVVANALLAMTRFGPRFSGSPVHPSGQGRDTSDPTSIWA